MARILSVKCKLCRREGEKLFLKDSRCYGPKCPLEKKGAVPPGQHGSKRIKKLSEFGRQLREKQKVKRIYGLSESQMKNYFLKAKKNTSKISQKMGKDTGENLFQLLELRLDNLVFKGGLAGSRSIARQLVVHGHVLVDGKKVNIPSYQVKPNQVITLSTTGLNMPLIKAHLEKKNNPPPAWIEKKGAALKILRVPKSEELNLDINKQLIIEYYSR